VDIENAKRKEPAMRTTRIDIEGDRGRATIFRSGNDIVINVTRRSGKPDATIRRGIGHNDSWLISASSRTHHVGHVFLARQLQETLDGFRGTAGDIEEYLRAIETFAD
jgi:hypothetical protein